MEAQQFIAIGESQSAGRLLTYVNAFAPIHARFEGYLIHSRTGGSAPLVGGFIEPELPTPEVVRVREDLGVPVLMLQTETDLFILDSWPSNQPDSANFRLWEIAGSAHADLYTFLDNRFDVGNDPGVAAVAEVLDPIPDIIECTVPVNAGPQHWVAKAAIAALNEWVVSGVAPPQAERLAVAGDSRTFELDAQGNVLGGIRTPYVDAPVAILSGEGQPDVEGGNFLQRFCRLFGTTALFPDATMFDLYPTEQSYIDAIDAATDSAVEAGFLLPADADLIKDRARTSGLGGAP